MSQALAIRAPGGVGPTGPDKAAILMLALGIDYGQNIWNKLDDGEIIVVSLAMSRLGTISAETLEQLLADFVAQMSHSGSVVGSTNMAERLLSQFLPPDRLKSVLEEIRGPAGRTMWEKLSNVQPHVLASYLKNEYPQTVAVVLSKMTAEHSGRVLTLLPEDLALDVVQRMLGMDAVQRDILEKIEQTLRSEFISNLSHSRKRDPHELMAEIFNSFDRQTESRFLQALDTADSGAAEKIKTLMFTFDDLLKLDRASIQALIRRADKTVLALASKGAPEAMRTFFFSNMSERTSAMLKTDIDGLGPVRLKDVDEAQTKMVLLAKELAVKGEIVITKGGASDDELVY